MKFNEDEIKKNLINSINNPTLMELYLDSFDGFNSEEVFKKYIDISKSLYNRNSFVSNNILIIDTNKKQNFEKLLREIYLKSKKNFKILNKLIIVKNPEGLNPKSLNLISEILKSTNMKISVVYLFERVMNQRRNRIPTRLESRTKKNIGYEPRSLTIIEQQKYDFCSSVSRYYSVYYGTNREYKDGEYIDKGDDKINSGHCIVNIPESHKFGSVGSNFFTRWNTGIDDRLKIYECNPLDKNIFFENIKELISEDDALIYIHGYNTSFNEATIRAAQIGFDLKSKLTAYFSWPSVGNLKSYLKDEDSIMVSEQYIMEFLENFTKNIKPEKIHIIAHSMGNRGLLRSFNRMFSSASEKLGIKFGQIFLAAPDVNIDLFKELATVYPKYSTRTTLYVSTKDKALGTSEWLHDFPRAGLMPPITVLEDIDTIEVTNIDLTTLGHGYFAEAHSLLNDMYSLIQTNKNPNDRIRLVPKENYWQFSE